MEIVFDSLHPHASFLLYIYFYILRCLSADRPFCLFLFCCGLSFVCCRLCVVVCVFVFLCFVFVLCSFWFVVLCCVLLSLVCVDLPGSGA